MFEQATLADYLLIPHLQHRAASQLFVQLWQLVTMLLSLFLLLLNSLKIIWTGPNLTLVYADHFWKTTLRKKTLSAEVVAKLTSSSVHLSLHPVRLLQGPGCKPRAAVIRHQKPKGKISPPSSSINLFGGSSVVQKDIVTPHRSSSPEHHVYLI